MWSALMAEPSWSRHGPCFWAPTTRLPTQVSHTDTPTPPPTPRRPRRSGAGRGAGGPLPSNSWRGQHLADQGFRHVVEQGDLAELPRQDEPHPPAGRLLVALHHGDHLINRPRRVRGRRQRERFEQPALAVGQFRLDEAVPF